MAAAAATAATSSISYAPTTKTLAPASKTAAGRVSFLSSAKHIGICVNGRRRCGGGTFAAKMISATSIGKPLLSLNFETSVFKKEKISLAGYDEVLFELFFALVSDEDFYLSLEILLGWKRSNSNW
jgi:ketol-acid reductoisomerase